ncbi:MAG: murein biosynthesis integral membrane protein MurJ [Candidatus Omnitrophica bacterium]|nr:murein biosynthesis integral membrane protein MurJ [Candidatus Omnitrophota bacterium]
MSTNKLPHPDSHRSLIQSTSILSLGTLTSRVLGFARDVITAKLLGTGFRADAFFVAFRIPNLFRDLVGEGAANAAVVPVLSEYKEKKDTRDFWELNSVLLALALIILSAITILGIVFAPVIVRVMAPGFIVDPQKLALTINLTRFVFPYLVFIGLIAYSMAVLFIFRSFTVPAFSPCLLNIAMIVCALIYTRTMDDPVLGLAVGVLIGGVLQLVVQLKPLVAVGMPRGWPKKLYHPGAAQMGKLLVPRMVGGGVYQLSVLLDTFCASLASIVGQGGISAVYYANRIIQCPMGIFGVAMATALLPTLSGFVQRQETGSFKRTVMFSLENIFFVMCPSTIALVLLADPVIRVFFERGEFGVYSTTITASALAYYALGLFSFGGIKILVMAFYALQDTKTPVKVAAFCLTINAALNFILMFPLKVGGIALASAVAGTVDFLMLFYILNRRLGGFDGDLRRYFVKVLAASVATGLVGFGLWYYLGFVPEAVRLGIIAVVWVCLYGAVCLALKIEQARKIWDWIKSVKSIS